MKTEQILPVILIVIQIGAAIVHGFKHNFWDTLYWLSAAAVNFAVVFRT